jgi:uncharacterized protein DUF4136
MVVRKFSAIIFLSFIALVVVAFAQDVSTDYDHHTDFYKYKTFAWIDPPAIKDPLIRQRVLDTIQAQLQEKGLKMVGNAAIADLGVMANGATMERHTLQTFYDGFPAGWGWGGWGPATTVNTYEVGTLVVDMFDMETKRVVWRGTATATVSEKPEKNTKKVDKAVTKMFKDFPPHLT